MLNLNFKYFLDDWPTLKEYADKKAIEVKDVDLVEYAKNVYGVIIKYWPNSMSQLAKFDSY